jgi:hypothetical protein
VLIVLLIVLIFYIVLNSESPQLAEPTNEAPIQPLIELTPNIMPSSNQSSITPLVPEPSIQETVQTQSLAQRVALPIMRHIIRHTLHRPRVVILGAHRRQMNQIRNTIINENARQENTQPENAQDLNPPATVEEEFQQLKGHAGIDNQNVHETTIRRVLTQKLLHLISLNKNYDDEAKELGMTSVDYLISKTLQSILEIKKIAIAYFNKMIYESNNTDHRITRQETDEKLHQISEVLSKISNGFPIVMKNDIAYREDFIMNQIWDRINCDANVDVRETLQTAFIHNILDCIRGKREPDENPLEDIIHIINTLTGEEFSTYCINGRVARLMSTFAHLDVDPILSKPIVDADEASNEAYDKAYHIYSKQLEMMSEDLKAIYDGDRDELTEEQQQQISKFDKDLKQLIEKELRNDYETLLESSQLEKVISRAVSVVI